MCLERQFRDQGACTFVATFKDHIFSSKYCQVYTEHFQGCFGIHPLGTWRFLNAFRLTTVKLSNIQLEHHCIFGPHNEKPILLAKNHTEGICNLEQYLRRPSENKVTVKNKFLECLSIICYNKPFLYYPFVSNKTG